MRTINEQELKDILDKHGKWIRNEENGERANLSYADLRYADLSSANLRYADLSYANLRYADLSYADLRYANLSSANLSSANLFNTVGLKFKPIQIVNTKFFITIMDDFVQWGCRKMTFDEVKAFEFKNCTERWDESEFKLNKKIITESIRYYRKETP
jgi:hypothetical protein